MAITLKISRSDRFPVGTLVKAYATGSRQYGQAPAGASVAEATVDANGLLTIEVPPLTELQLYASVEEEARYLRVGDPAVDTALEPLRARIARRRVLVGA